MNAMTNDDQVLKELGRRNDQGTFLVTTGLTITIAGITTFSALGKANEYLWPLGIFAGAGVMATIFGVFVLSIRCFDGDHSDSLRKIRRRAKIGLGFLVIGVEIAALVAGAITIS